MERGNQAVLERLAQVKTFMLDLDGTVYLGNKLFPWTLSFLAKLIETGRDYIFVTNNSSKNARHYLTKLQAMGVELTADRIFTSGEATRYYLQKNNLGPKLFVAGTPELEEEFCGAGFVLTKYDPDAVVLGFDLTLTYEKLRTVCALVRRGIPFIATHPDYNCPTPEGPIPDCGAMIAAVTAATGVKPKIIGKPHPEMVEALCVKFGFALSSVAMVGDRLYTDIAMGKQANILSILVLSGETVTEDLVDASIQPDLVADNLGALQKWL